jgi:hypothetical protein
VRLQLQWNALGANSEWHVVANGAGIAPPAAECRGGSIERRAKQTERTRVLASVGLAYDSIACHVDTVFDLFGRARSVDWLGLGLGFGQELKMGDVAN